MLRLALDRVRIESGQIWIRVDSGLGHSCSGWIGLSMNRFRFGFGSGHFGFGFTLGHFGFGSDRFNSGHFGFGFISDQ